MILQEVFSTAQLMVYPRQKSPGSRWTRRRPASAASWLVEATRWPRRRRPPPRRRLRTLSRCGRSWRTTTASGSGLSPPTSSGPTCTRRRTSVGPRARAASSFRGRFLSEQVSLLDPTEFHFPLQRFSLFSPSLSNNLNCFNNDCALGFLLHNYMFTHLLLGIVWSFWLQWIASEWPQA